MQQANPAVIAFELRSQNVGPGNFEQAIRLDAEGINVMRAASGSPRRQAGEFEHWEELNRGEPGRKGCRAAEAKPHDTQRETPAQLEPPTAPHPVNANSERNAQPSRATPCGTQSIQ